MCRVQLGKTIRIYFCCTLRQGQKVVPKEPATVHLEVDWPYYASTDTNNRLITLPPNNSTISWIHTCSWIPPLTTDMTSHPQLTKVKGYKTSEITTARLPLSTQHPANSMNYHNFIFKLKESEQAKQKARGNCSLKIQLRNLVKMYACCL